MAKDLFSTLLGYTQDLASKSNNALAKQFTSMMATEKVKQVAQFAYTYRDQIATAVTVGVVVVLAAVLFCINPAVLQSIASYAINNINQIKIWFQGAKDAVNTAMVWIGGLFFSVDESKSFQEVLEKGATAWKKLWELYECSQDKPRIGKDIELTGKEKQD